MALTIEVEGIEFTDLTTGLLGIDRKLNRALKSSAPKVSFALRKALQLVADRMAEQHGDPWRPGRSRRGRLFRRTGAGLKGLRKSIRVTRATSGLDAVRGSISAPFPLSVHETGATIRPTTAEFLTIPLPAALDARGVPLRRRARDWDNTFVATSRRGNLLIFRRDGGGRATPLYVLKREVRIPPRLGLLRTVDKVGIPFFERRALQIIDRELRD